MNMEGGHHNGEMNSSSNISTSCGSDGIGAPASSNSRWNPTKEQINILESLYKQGIRTPTADQIQQITTRLRTFGHIEGKNVFYWFQNHKARQRQKQKQESMAYINRFLHRSNHPIFPSNSHPRPNVVCSPYFLPVVQQPHDVIGVHQQYYHPNKVPLSSTIRRRSPRLDKLEKSARIISCAAGAGYEPAPQSVAGGICTADIGGNAAVFEVNCNQAETLPLFPVSPTGILQGKEDCSSYNNVADTNRSSISNPSSSSEVDQEGCSSSHEQPFFDFFSK